jgi:hypothetical protein
VAYRAGLNQCRRIRRALCIDRLEACEPRSYITDPLGLMLVGYGITPALPLVIETAEGVAIPGDEADALLMRTDAGNFDQLRVQDAARKRANQADLHELLFYYKTDSAEMRMMATSYSEFEIDPPETSEPSDHIIVAEPTAVGSYPNQPSPESLPDERYIIDFIRPQLAQPVAQENEQGGYVYYNSTTGQILIVEVEMTEAAGEGGPNRRASAPQRPGFGVIAGWHTHRIDDEANDISTIPGPSGSDYNHVIENNRPELVIEPSYLGGLNGPGRKTYVIVPDGNGGTTTTEVPFPNRDLDFPPP